MRRLLTVCHLLFIDLGLIRLFFNRPAEVVPGVWRSNQPTPWRINSLAQRGFKTVLNLRGEGKSSAFRLEVEACQRTQVTLHNLKMSSRRPPTKDQLQALRQLFHEAPRPLLLHCKSGADRAGLVSALFLLWSGRPLDEAKQALSWRYLHIRHAATGMMDWFLLAYENAYRQTSVGFDEWLDNHYDREQVTRSFNPKGPLVWLVDVVLRRE
ncbi:tyrosine-protein phosphatase [Salinispirillum marinum]|uniref:Tyrosine-protein phosphatase n=2 Tax=Saccharospirillaceae TaxID=255527 RepID=A0ABV8BI57_9GAMM